MAKGSKAEADRARISEVERVRELRMAAWSLTRNEGIREGLMMAMTACHDLPGDTPFLEAIKTHGNRHFGDSKWQTQARKHGTVHTQDPGPRSSM